MGVRRGQRGSVAVEFGLVFPLLLLVVVGFAALAQVSVTKVRVAHAAWLGQMWMAQGLPAQEAERRVCAWLVGGDATANRDAGTCQVRHRRDETGVVVYQVRRALRLGSPGVARFLQREHEVTAEWVEVPAVAGKPAMFGRDLAAGNEP